MLEDDIVDQRHRLRKRLPISEHYFLVGHKPLRDGVNRVECQDFQRSRGTRAHEAGSVGHILVAFRTVAHLCYARG